MEEETKPVEEVVPEVAPVVESQIEANTPEASVE